MAKPLPTPAAEPSEGAELIIEHIQKHVDALTPHSPLDQRVQAVVDLHYIVAAATAAIGRAYFRAVDRRYADDGTHRTFAEMVGITRLSKSAITNRVAQGAAQLGYMPTTNWTNTTKEDTE